MISEISGLTEQSMKQMKKYTYRNHYQHDITLCSSNIAEDVLNRTKASLTDLRRKKELQMKKLNGMF